jgi:hypothetical protein
MSEIGAVHHEAFDAVEWIHPPIVR